MSESHLYRKIIASIRQGILSGELKPGDRLPPVREMAQRWECTNGTVQRAYRELAQQGLILSRAGQGTHVAGKLSVQEETPLRRATLIHQAENFLLEALGSGYNLAEIESAVRQAIDRWRVVELERPPEQQSLLRFAGSHDLAIAWLPDQLAKIAPGCTLQLHFTGSLRGLIALAEENADLAGSHLWDDESGSYNAAHVRRLLPGQRVALLTLAQRNLGLILPPGNPASLQSLQDLARPGLRFVNRQPGSGTRVWLDVTLQQVGIAREQITGYQNEKMTHSAVALEVAEGKADVGFGLHGAALNYGLDFIPLQPEIYHLVIPEKNWEHPAIQAIANWLQTPAACSTLENLGGYITTQTGQVEWVS